MADIFLVQDEIVSQIVAKIAGNYGVIEITEARSATRKSPDEVQAYDLVLRAQDAMRPEWSHETFSAAKGLLRRAIALDPSNARARRELAYLAMRDEDIAKLMDGVYKSGVLEAEAKPGQ